MDLVESDVAMASGIGLVLLRLDGELGAAHVEGPYQMRRNFTRVLVADALAVDASVITGPAAHVDRVRGAVALVERVNMRVESEGLVERRRIELGGGNHGLGGKGQ